MRNATSQMHGAKSVGSMRGSVVHPPPLVHPGIFRP